MQSLQLYVLLSLGSNLGDRINYLQIAVNDLKCFSNSDIHSISWVYESPAWGVQNSPPYLNAAILLIIDINTYIINHSNSINHTMINYNLDISNYNYTNHHIKNRIDRILHDLLTYCQSIETKNHRIRVIDQQYADRTLDIDILYAELSNDYYFFNKEYVLQRIQINHSNLIIPHIQLPFRAFALKTALDIWYSKNSRQSLLIWYNHQSIQYDSRDLIKINNYLY